MSRKNLLIIVLVMSTLPFLYGREAVHSQQKNAVYHNKKGWENLQAGDTYSAIVSFQSALAQNPKYKEALLGLGHAYLKTEGFDESVRLFNAVLKLYPKNEQALLGMAKAYTDLGRYQEAIQLYDTLNELSYENNESRYGMAYLYFRMGRMLWSRRLLSRILQTDPYHYEALMLSADIKAKDKRIDDAINLVKKAIDAKETHPDAFVKLAELLYIQYYYSGDTSYIHEAINELRKAILLNKTHLQANRDLGYLLFIQGEYLNAITHYEAIVKNYPFIAKSEILYNLGLMHQHTGNILRSLDYFVQALSRDSTNSFIGMKIRQLCLLERVKTGHPVRIQSSIDDFSASQELRRKGFPDLSLMFARLSLSLNPNNNSARNELLRIYETLGYFDLYYEEIRKMHAMNPTQRTHDLMSIAVMKRRDKLFFRLGYDRQELHRDVPMVLTLNFKPEVPIPAFLDAGAVIANSINFAMGQYGRYGNFTMTQREAIVKDFASDDLDNILSVLNDKINRKEIPAIAYLLFGEYSLSGRHIELDAKLMDVRTGVIISRYNASDKGKFSIQAVSLNIAQRLYDTIPFWGTIQSTMDGMIAVNLGRIDGLDSGSLLETFVDDDTADPLRLRKKVIFQVKEADTHVLLAQPINEKDLDLVSVGQIIYPVEKRRAKRIK